MCSCLYGRLRDCHQNMLRNMLHHPHRFPGHWILSAQETGCHGILFRLLEYRRFYSDPCLLSFGYSPLLIRAYRLLSSQNDFESYHVVLDICEKSIVCETLWWLRVPRKNDRHHHQRAYAIYHLFHAIHDLLFHCVHDHANRYWKVWKVK